MKELNSIINYECSGLNFPIEKVPDDFPDLPETGIVFDAANFSVAVGAFEVKDLEVFESHFKASNIFSGVFGMELEWEVFHVFADERLDGAGLRLGEDLEVIGNVHYEVFVVLWKLEGVFIEFWASEVGHFVDQGWVEVDLLYACE